MKSNFVISVLTYFVLFLKYHGVRGGIRPIVPEIGSPTGPIINSTQSTTPNGNQTSGLQTVEERMVLKRGKELQNLWRTENDKLVELNFLTEDRSIDPEENLKLNIALTNQMYGNAASQRGSGLDFYKNPTEESLPTAKKEQSTIKGSSRQKRTFWPFSNLFGSYYDYIPPSPMFGPGVPPFGMGMGMGMGPGMGMSPFFPPPPPPFGFGLGFMLGL